jgi:hypothetical protein
MKFRVKFKCYQYNTGRGDNKSYDKFEDFDTIEQATDYSNKVKKHLEMRNLTSDDKDWLEKIEEWENSENFIEIEDGYIEHYIGIFKYFPSREELISDI